MSTSLANARRKFDALVRGIHLPTDIDPQDPDELGGVLLLAVLQSRLNWSNGVFAKYRHDNVNQPRRAANTRKKWPNMNYIGTYTLHLGPHVFPHTAFYEAVRQETWADVGVAAGVIQPMSKPEPVDPPPLTDVASDVPMAEASQMSVHTDYSEESGSQTTVLESAGPPSTAMVSSTVPKLTYYDIVFEFKEVPNERFVLPKNAIAECISDQHEVLVSFILPLDSVSEEDYFKEPMEKIALWGTSSEDPDIVAAIPMAQNAQKEAKASAEKDEENGKPITHQAVTIKLEGTDDKIWDAISKALKPVEVVQASMMEKMQSIPVRHFLQYRTSYDAADDTIETLKSKINTIPEVTIGPVAAEKKRNELLNAIKLGKRPHSDYHEHETAAQKRGAVHLKDDNLRKCHYCSTRHTSMWRRGPDGGGTLCNGCGLRWKQGEILVGAPVISWQEEKQLAKERKKEEDRVDADMVPEQEKVEPVEKKKHGKTPTARAGLDISGGPATTKNIGYVAAQIVQQQHQQAMLQNTSLGGVSAIPVVTPSPHQSISPPSATPVSAAPKAPTRKKSAGKTAAQAPLPPPPSNSTVTTTTTATSTSRLMSSAPAPTPTAAPMNAVQQSVTSGAGIPLPTLSIVFSDTIAFTHPNCGVSLLEDVFFIKLRKDGFEPTTIDIHKQFLQQSQFNIVFEGEARREILVMTATLGSNYEAVTRFDQKLIDPELTTRQHDLKIRFLEKLDPSGGGVVKRILERWVSANSLASISGTPSPTEPSSALSKSADKEGN
ncbi:hypothetical protein Unana1_04461 [Umbelopsis nana]